MQFEFYVLNYNFNKKAVERFNIFNNSLVQEKTEKAIKKYLRSPKKYTYVKHSIPKEFDCEIYGFEALCEEIRSIIMWQEWSRCEYEIVVGGWPFSVKNDNLEKVDCFYQAEKNIPMIARECLYQYKHYVKENKNGN